MTLSKIISREVATVEAKATVEEAARLMREVHVGDVVVVKKELGRSVPTGFLTDRDIVMSVIALGLDPKIMLIEDVMSSNLISAKTTDSLQHVIGLMKENGIQRVPVMDPQGELVGIASVHDLLQLIASELTDLTKVFREQHHQETDRRRHLA